VLKTYIPSDAAEGQDVDAKKVLLWDRKAKGGFPGNHRNITVEVVTYL
jgi:predicted Rdx family selenoprotein